MTKLADYEELSSLTKFEEAEKYQCSFGPVSRNSTRNSKYGMNLPARRVIDWCLYQRKTVKNVIKKAERDQRKPDMNRHLH